MLSFVPSVVFASGRTLFQKGSHADKYFVSWKTPPPGFGSHRVWSITMHSLHFHNLAHWFFQFESYGPAILVTIGAALLIACGIGATCSPCEEKDEVFHRQVF
jgi:hypothetical protein